MEGDESSLKAWFPDLAFENEKISDPRYHNCFNPVRAGINLCDKVHAVSPTYAKESLLPSRAAQGYFGGEGLEYDLLNAAHSERLFGILNGCEYPLQKYESLSFDELISFSEKEVLKWISTNALVDKAHLVAITRIKQLLAKTKNLRPIVLTSVGRITDQKVKLFQQVMPDGKTALEHLLTILSNDGVFVLLGSGATQLEEFLTDIATRHSNFLFLKGYSQALSEKIYCSGDLFLMPSSFEPCGISQMLSMRAGQPCLAHNGGGLADTIIDDVNGFTFTGATPLEQASNMLMYFENILAKKKKSPKKWAEISKSAMNERFLWRDVAQDYVKYLYS
jgi:starch synthase